MHRCHGSPSARASGTMAASFPAPESATAMQCPKCHAAMHLLANQESPVHRCEGCHGLWFELMAHEDLRDHADEIDLVEPDPALEDQPLPADPAAPAPTLLCPACTHYPLIHMVDPQQPHIRFESCKFCYGRFYDAGEFRDFADEGDHETTLDKFIKVVAAKLAG